MFHAAAEQNTITITFSSTMTFVDQAVAKIEELLRLQNVSPSFECKVILRELLINAVEHGNRLLPELNVTCRIKAGKKELLIRVEDEGDGFDPDSINMTMPEDPLEERNRGYALINAFSRKITFNDRANRVTVYLDNFNKETS